MYFDTHCHLNFKRLYENLESVISDAKAVGVTRMIVPGTDIESSEKAVEIAQKYEGIYAAVGIHPHHAFGVEGKTQNSNAKTITQKSKVEELEMLLLSDGKTSGVKEVPTESDSVPTPEVEEERRIIVAIGEIGLDRHEYQQTKYERYSIDETFIAAQKELFVAQLELAKKYGLSVIIHNREAKQDTLEIFGRPVFAKALAGRAVFHCCEPDLELLDFAIQHRVLIGVDGDVTWDKPSFAKASAGKAAFIKTVPLEMLVLETDAPFLLPESLRREKKYPNVPANLPLIAQFVADLKGISVEEVAEHTTSNAKQLFNITA